MMPGGDEDDIEEFPEMENEDKKVSKKQMDSQVNDKFSSLYDDAKHRNLR